MRLIVVNSSSSGNAYALDSDKEILLLEAGCRLAEVKKAIDYRLKDVVGCLITHNHQDHSKHAADYAKQGIKVYCNEDIAERKTFPFGTCQVLTDSKTVTIGAFRVVPFKVNHANNDGTPCPSLGYIIHHEDCGTIFFALDSYKFDFAVTGIDHWLIEANYDDRILKANVEDGRIDRAQANRLMLSHMSLDNTIHFLHECHAEDSKTITLCHLSSRNSHPKAFADRVAGEFGVPTQVAAKGIIVELNKEVI